MDTADRLVVRFGSQDTTGPTDTPVDRITDSPAISDRCDGIRMEPTQTGPLLDNSHSAGGDHMEDELLQISGAGHWFLDGWIGDQFLVDSGSSVTTMSHSLYQSLVRAGAPVGTLGCTSRTLRGANGTGIVVTGCSHCVVSFMGLLEEFPILVCDLASGMDAIIGTDVLGSVLPHTLDIKNGLLFTEGGTSLQLHRRNDALSGHVFTVGHLLCSPLFGSCVTLYCTYCWGTRDAL